MPTYVYLCPLCSTSFDVVKRMADLNQDEACKACGCVCKSTDRQPTRTYFYGAKVEDAAFDPAFGKVIKSSRHRADEAKARGWIEVGNEKPETIEKHFDKQREDTREQRWQDAAKVKLYE